MVNIIYFYGHNDVEKGWMSNFYPVQFEVDGIEYCCSEQYLMKMKQELFDPDNVDLAEKILHTRVPSKIKNFGRQVRNYNEDIWNAERYQVMVKGLMGKFSQNLALKRNLLNTGNQILAEASPTDNIWGIGMSEENAQRVGQAGWRGTNLLGNALMEVRERLRAE
jgi:ribA/ribD-fused uncharacterized protein